MKNPRLTRIAGQLPVLIDPYNGDLLRSTKGYCFLFGVLSADLRAKTTGGEKVCKFAELRKTQKNPTGIYSDPFQIRFRTISKPFRNRYRWRYFCVTAFNIHTLQAHC